MMMMMMMMTMTEKNAKKHSFDMGVHQFALCVPGK